MPISMARMQVSVNLGEDDYDPQAFVTATAYAEQMGFRMAWFGDHIFPWFHSSNESPFVWSLMAAALEKTDSIKIGPFVTVPIGARYHPAIIAQAAATLDNMYPGRIQLGVGSGEALNERAFWNDHWPKWEERMERLVEGIRLMRMMWESKKPFRFDGKFFRSDFYYLYTKPKKRIPVYASAVGRRAAYYAGVNADGLITISPRNDLQQLKEVFFPAYMRGRSEAGKKDSGRVIIELYFTLQKPEAYLKKAWRSLGILLKGSYDFPNPVEAEGEGKRVTVDDVRRNFHVCKTWKELVKVIEAYQEVGADEVSLYTSCEKTLIRTIAQNVSCVF